MSTTQTEETEVAWVLGKDRCGHYAVGLQGGQLYAAVEHLGEFYHVVDTFEASPDADPEKLLKEHSFEDEEEGEA